MKETTPALQPVQTYQLPVTSGPAATRKNELQGYLSGRGRISEENIREALRDAMASAAAQFGWEKGDAMPMGEMGDYSFLSHDGGVHHSGDGQLTARDRGHRPFRQQPRPGRRV